MCTHFLFSPWVLYDCKPASIRHNQLVQFISQFSVSQFSLSVVSDSLWPHGLQHTRLSCPSPTRGAFSNSWPSSRWCHPTLSSSVAPFSSCLQSFPASGSFPMSQFFTSGGQSIGASTLASVFSMNIQDCLLLPLLKIVTGIPPFIVLHFNAIWRYCTFSFFFYKLKVYGNPVPSKSIGSFFPVAFTHYIFFCHILVILTILQICWFWLYLLWWSVIFFFPGPATCLVGS